MPTIEERLDKIEAEIKALRILLPTGETAATFLILQGIGEYDFVPLT